MIASSATDLQFISKSAMIRNGWRLQIILLCNQSKRRNCHNALLKAKRFAMICTFSDATQRELRTILNCDRFAASQRGDLPHWLATSLDTLQWSCGGWRWHDGGCGQKARRMLQDAFRTPSERLPNAFGAMISPAEELQPSCRSIWISHMGWFYDSASPQNWDSSFWSKHIGSCGCEVFRV